MNGDTPAVQKEHHGRVGKSMGGTDFVLGFFFFLREAGRGRYLLHVLDELFGWMLFSVVGDGFYWTWEGTLKILVEDHKSDVFRATTEKGE